MASVYTAYHLLWSLGTSFLLFRCAAQPSWALARFLSAPIFQPLSRLSFSVYLVHYVVIPYSVVRSGTVLHLEHAGEFVSALYIFFVYFISCYLFCFYELFVVDF